MSTNAQLQSDYCASLQQQRAQADEDIATMNASSNQIAADEEDENSHGCKKKQKEADEQDIQEQQEIYDAAEADLLTIDPGMASYCDTQDAILEDEESVAHDSSIKKKDRRSDIEQLNENSNTIYTAMYSGVEADLDAQAINEDGANMTNAQLQALACDGMNASAAESATLNSLVDQMTSQIQAYEDQEDDAEVKKSKHSYATGALLGGTGELLVWHSKSSAQKTINNDNFMINALTNIMVDLAPEMSKASPELLEMQFLMEGVMRQAEAIMKNDSLSPKDKQMQLLQLMMLALGIFNQVKMDAQSQKAENTQNMSKANSISSEASMNKTHADSLIQQNMAHHEMIMKIEEKVMSAALIALAMALAPGVGAMAVIAILGALEESGVLTKATDALGNAMGCQWGADLVVAAIETAVTLGVGYGLEKAAAEAASVIAETAVQDAMASPALQETIQTAVEEIVEDVAGKTGTSLASDGAEQVAREQLELVAREAAEKAAQSMTEEFLSQPTGTLAEMIAKGTFKTSLQTAVSEAAEQAARLAVENTELLVQPIMDDAGNISDVVVQPLAEEAVEKISSEAAKTTVKESIMEKTNQTEEKVVKKLERSAMRKFLVQGATVGVASAANTNLLVDSIRASIQAAMGADSMDDKWVKRVTEMLKVLEALIEMLAMFSLAGGASGVFDGSPTTWLKIANGAQAVGMGVSAETSFNIMGTDLKKATATKNLQIDSATSEMLQESIQQLLADSQTDQKRFLQDFRSSSALEAAIAGQLLKGNMAGIRILATAV